MRLNWLRQNMISSIEVKSKIGKKLVNNDNKITSIFILSRQLTRIPSSSLMPMMSIPMIQLEINSTSSASSISLISAINSPHQISKNNNPIKKAQNSLNSALKHFNESFQATCNKISQDVDRIMA